MTASSQRRKLIEDNMHPMNRIWMFIENAKEIIRANVYNTNTLAVTQRDTHTKRDTLTKITMKGKKS